VADRNVVAVVDLQVALDQLGVLLGRGGAADLHRRSECHAMALDVRDTRTIHMDACVLETLRERTPDDHHLERRHDPGIDLRRR
jgi:hypothetical protein